MSFPAWRLSIWQTSMLDQHDNHKAWQPDDDADSKEAFYGTRSRHDTLQHGRMACNLSKREWSQGRDLDDHCSSTKDHEWDVDDLLALCLAHDDHLCHHLLQAFLLWGRPLCEPDQHVGHDDHLHQCHGETPFDLLPQDDWHLADFLPVVAIFRGRPFT